MNVNSISFIKWLQYMLGTRTKGRPCIIREEGKTPILNYWKLSANFSSSHFH